MNRSILIVICDFLLVSLLLFSTPDLNKLPHENTTQPAPKPALTTNQAKRVNSRQDLAAVMREALTQEQEGRNQLLKQLNETRSALNAREKRVQEVQQQLQSKEQAAQQLQTKQQDLARQFTVAQSRIQNLNQQLQSASSQAVLSKEQLAALKEEARKRTKQAKALQDQLTSLSKSNQMVLDEKQKLSTRLLVAQAQQTAATQQIALLSDQVKVQREQNAKLSAGVQALAAKSDQLVHAVQSSHALAPNTIFSQFVTNQVQARFHAVRNGLFGGTPDVQQANTVLVTDGTNIFAVCHVRDTPFTLWNPGADWQSLTGTLNHDKTQIPISSLAFSWTDPRIVWMPVTSAQAKKLGCKVYRISSDPYKFQDAVLVGGQEGYYGECRFQIDLSTPGYLKLNRSFIKGLFGKFNPSRGDLVFSKTGKLLGIMANGTYCLMLHNFDAAATVRFGPDVTQNTGPILSDLYMQVAQMPSKLQ